MYETEEGVDGGFLEISNDGGLVWEIIRDGFIKNDYNNEISYSTFAIPALRGFSGSTNGQFIDSYLDLSKWKGQDIQVRFRFGSDAKGASPEVIKGWIVDDVEIMDLLVYETTACIANADNANGSCSVNRKIIIDSDGIVATHDNDAEVITHQVYPNPAHDYIVIDLQSEKAGAVNIALSNLDGKEIYSKHVRIHEGRNVESIQTHHLTPGVYLVKVQDGNSLKSHKVIIH